MHLKRGKIVFSKRDCWNMAGTLDVVIHSALVKLKEELEKDMFKGYPGNVGSMEEWYDILDKMIYAFDSSNEPDILAYDFEFVEGPEHGQEDYRGFIRWNMVPDNPEEYQAYKEADKEYDRKVAEGRHLFAEYYGPYGS